MISKDFQNKCTLTNNTRRSSSGAAGYSRFLVLEVSRRELLGQEVVAKYGRHLSEKVLRLFDETLSQEKFCSLREDWEMSEVEPGDIVHITGMYILSWYLIPISGEHLPHYKISAVDWNKINFQEEDKLM